MPDPALQTPFEPPPPPPGEKLDLPATQLEPPLLEPLGRVDPFGELAIEPEDGPDALD